MDALALSDARLKAFLGSAVLALPGLAWQAYVLGTSFRARRGKPVADTNALAAPAAKLQAAATAAKNAATGVPSPQAPPETAPPETTPTDDATPTASSSLARGRPLLFIGGAALLFLAAKAWLARVLATVPEPYLDEVFHIPQAQTFCAGRWRDWDDMITTPPGLYLVSVALKYVWTSGEAVSETHGIGDGCSVWTLRAANNVAIVLVAAAAASCRAANESNRNTKSKGGRLLSLYAFHSALNMALFPVLFFFAALYYTDVYATLAVLLAYRHHLSRVATAAAPPLWSDLVALALGLATLVFRQTNVFWAVVYLGGLEAVHALLQRVRPQYAETLLGASPPSDGKDKTVAFASAWGMAKVYAWRWAHGDVHDPPLGASWPDDWVLAAASVAVGVACNLPTVLRQVWPHVATLGAFAGFVVWNGGVVLGDKANHVATVHAAQLLYVWALMAFFSAPLFVSHAWGYLMHLLARGEPDKTGKDATLPPATVAAFATNNSLLRLLHVVFVKKGYYVLYLAAIFNAALAVVRYNTLVHPFTLADNRHYMFYVFRYTIRNGVVRYALVPVYCVCAWACWRVLWGVPGQDAEAAGNFCSPFAAQTTDLASLQGGAMPDVAADEPGPGPEPEAEPRKTGKAARKDKLASQKKAKKAAKAATPAASMDDSPPAVFLSFLDEDEDGAASAARTGPTTSTALLWLAATSLSLVTAPLVEPRYFILPWVCWRLLVPAASRHKVDARLVLETVWFAVINAATMYLFLYRPYVWRSADGALLDGGRLQRFMW